MRTLSNGSSLRGARWRPASRSQSCRPLQRPAARRRRARLSGSSAKRTDVAATLIYLDSSALVKLVVHENGTDELRAWLSSHPAVVSSAVAVTEVRRAIGRISARRSLSDRARLVLDGVALLTVDNAVLEVAAGLMPPGLRTLDAIHVASALSLGADLLAFVTYDDRQAGAARKAGLPVMRP
ncbi:MAG: type II toxin-antitoxin system VapC family toxin [Holophagales bacterium]|nr:type II toxin-antitoxin system VapC family toxin [Holophagales bacterium]